MTTPVPTPADTIIVFSKGDEFKLLGSGERGAAALPTDQLRKNLEAFTQSLRTVLPAVADAGDGFKLNSVEVAVGIDGKGHVGFLGTGVDVGAQATIKLAFRR